MEEITKLLRNALCILAACLVAVKQLSVQPQVREMLTLQEGFGLSQCIVSDSVETLTASHPKYCLRNSASFKSQLTSALSGQSHLLVPNATNLHFDFAVT